MAWKHRLRVGSLGLAVAGWALRWLLIALGRTCRVEIVAGGEHVAELLRAPRPVVLSFWHNRSFLAVGFLLDGLHRRGLDVTLLASQSRDGELAARVVRRWGVETVRGSSSRGGREALRGVYRAIVERRSSPIMSPDGPRGPLYEFKVGVAVLAQMAQAPILPLGFAAERFWRIKSWDRMIIPRPFTRIALAVGAPQSVARGGSPAELEARRREIEAALDEVTGAAEAAVGAEDVARETAREPARVTPSGPGAGAPPRDPDSPALR